MDQKTRIRAIDVLAKSGVSDGHDAYRDSKKPYIIEVKDGIKIAYKTNKSQTEILLAAKGIALCTIQKVEGEYGIIGSRIVTAGTDAKEIEKTLKALEEGFGRYHSGTVVRHYGMIGLAPGDICVTICCPKDSKGGCDVGMGDMDYMLTEMVMKFPQSITPPRSGEAHEVAFNGIEIRGYKKDKQVSTTVYRMPESIKD
jgi:hypothetical protein